MPTQSKRKLLAFGGLLVIVSLPVALLFFLRSEIVQPLPVGQPVPRVELVSLKEQTPMVLGDAKGTKQVVLFFTVECSACQNGLLNFEVLYRRYKARGSFVAISLSGVTKTTEFLHEQRFSFPVAVDEDKTAKEAYRIAAIPALFLIDEHAVLRHRRVGGASLQSDEQLVLSFLNETTELSTR